MKEKPIDTRVISEIVKDSDVTHVALHIPDRTLARVVKQVEDGNFDMMSESDIRVTAPSGREFIGHFIRYDGEGKKIIWDRNSDFYFERKAPVPKTIYTISKGVINNPTCRPMDVGDSSETFGTSII